MRIAVVVPSYRRPGDLARCLEALARQERAADTVHVVLRTDDETSRELCANRAAAWPALHVSLVSRPGVVAAMNAGLADADGDVIALTDDDAEPRPDWLVRIEGHFAADPGVGGVGGRDEQAGVEGSAPDVGRVQWFGRIVGNHHVGVGAARDVDVLKGANCAFRLEPLRIIGFDERLRGQGAQVHWELSLCLALRRAGWRLVYDPDIRVRHNVGARHGDDQLHRGRFDVAPHEDAVYNETLAIAEHFGTVRRMVFGVWAVLVGTAAEPGFVQLPRVMAREGRVALARWRATQRARRAGFASSRASAR